MHPSKLSTTMVHRGFIQCSYKTRKQVAGYLDFFFFFN